MACESGRIVCSDCEESYPEHEVFTCETCQMLQESTANNELAEAHFYCDTCIFRHCKKGHKIMDNSSQTVLVCDEHKLLLNKYCRDCDSLLCFKCMESHSGHKLMTIEIRAKEIRKAVSEQLAIFETEEKSVTEKKDRNPRTAITNVQRMQKIIEAFDETKNSMLSELEKADQKAMVSIEVSLQKQNDFRDLLILSCQELIFKWKDVNKRYEEVETAKTGHDELYLIDESQDSSWSPDPFTWEEAFHQNTGKKGKWTSKKEKLRRNLGSVNLYETDGREVISGGIKTQSNVPDDRFPLLGIFKPPLKTHKFVRRCENPLLTCMTENKPAVLERCDSGTTLTTPPSRQRAEDELQELVTKLATSWFGSLGLSLFVGDIRKEKNVHVDTRIGYLNVLVQKGDIIELSIYSIDTKDCGYKRDIKRTMKAINLTSSIKLIKTVFQFGVVFYLSNDMILRADFHEKPSLKKCENPTRGVLLCPFSKYGTDTEWLFWEDEHVRFTCNDKFRLKLKRQPQVMNIDENGWCILLEPESMLLTVVNYDSEEQIEIPQSFHGCDTLDFVTSTQPYLDQFFMYILLWTVKEKSITIVHISNYEFQRPTCEVKGKVNWVDDFEIKLFRTEDDFCTISWLFLPAVKLNVCSDNDSSIRIKIRQWAFMHEVLKNTK